MHKRMRRGKEMYSSFDTRRVLCKQQRPYCVKPFGAYLKQNNAKVAGGLLSQNGQGNFAQIALRKDGVKDLGRPYVGEEHYSQMLKELKEELTGPKITKEFAKSNELGMRRITSRRPICVSARFAKNNTYRALRLARFVPTNARRMAKQGGRDLFTVPQPSKEESKSVNIVNASALKLRNTKTE